MRSDPGKDAPPPLPNSKLPTFPSVTPTPGGYTPDFTNKETEAGGLPKATGGLGLALEVEPWSQPCGMVLPLGDKGDKWEPCEL